jgi:hypothetical protein
MNPLSSSVPGHEPFLIGARGCALTSFLIYESSNEPFTFPNNLIIKAI